MMSDELRNKLPLMAFRKYTLFRNSVSFIINSSFFILNSSLKKRSFRFVFYATTFLFLSLLNNFLNPATATIKPFLLVDFKNTANAINTKADNN